MKEGLLFYPGSGGKDSEGDEYKRLPIEKVRYLADKRKKGAVEFRQDGFVKLYGEKQVEADRQWVIRKRKQFAEKMEEDLIKKNIPAVRRPKMREIAEAQKDFSSAFEYSLGHLAEYGNWFGKGVFFMLTSEYDDFRGVDAIAEATTKGEAGTVKQPLSIDVTRAYVPQADYTKAEEEFLSQNGVIDKLRTTLAVIGGKETREVKYFSSGKAGEKHFERLMDIIPIVVALEPARAMELVRQVARSRELLDIDPKTTGRARTETENVELRELRAQFTNNPLQMVVLREIETQLAFFRDLLATSNHARVQIMLTAVEGGLKHVRASTAEKERLFAGKKIPSDQSASEIMHWISDMRASRKVA